MPGSHVGPLKLVKNKKKIYFYWFKSLPNFELLSDFEKLQLTLIILLNKLNIFKRQVISQEIFEAVKKLD